MTTLFATVLAFFIAAYGFLLVIGGGPRYANKLPRAVGRTAFGVVGGILRELIQAACVALGSAIRFVFDRPRR